MMEKDDERRAKARLTYDVDELARYFEERGEDEMMMLGKDLRDASDMPDPQREKSDVMRDFVFRNGMAELEPLFSSTAYDFYIAGFADALMVRNPFALDQTGQPFTDREVKGFADGAETAERDLETDTARVIYGSGEGRKVKYSDREIEIIRNLIMRDVAKRDGYREYLRERIHSGTKARTFEGFRKKFARLKRAMEDLA